jgi:hypothetical protein
VPSYVFWQTPSHRTLSSTSQSGGQFFLNVPNPIENGVYTCRINPSSSALHCAQPGSSLLQGASVNVDATSGMLTLLSARVQRLETQNGQLQQQVR